MKRTKEQAAETRAAVLRAGREVFATQGYADATIAEIARLAGATHGAIYHHFAGKEALFAAVYDEVVVDLDARVRDAALTGTDSWSIFRNGCRASLEAMAEPTYQAIALTDAPSVLGMAEWRRRDSEVGIATMRFGLVVLQGDGLLPDGDVSALAAILFGGLTESGLRLTSSDPGYTVDDVVDTVQALLEALNRSGSLLPVGALDG